MDLSQALNPKTWRKVGAISVGLAALMAVFGAATGILRDTVLHMAILMSPDVADRATPERAGPFCMVYWLVFALLILIALYMAFLDIRYIRLMYAVEKRKLFQASMGEDLLGMEVPKDEDKE